MTELLSHLPQPVKLAHILRCKSTMSSGAQLSRGNTLSSMGTALAKLNSDASTQEHTNFYL